MEPKQGPIEKEDGTQKWRFGSDDFTLQIGYIYYIYICFGFHVDFQGSICYVPSG